MTSIGRLREIWRYPVKSMGGERLAGCHVGIDGVRGDRAWVLRHRETGVVQGGTRLPAVMRCRACYVTDPEAAAETGTPPHVEITLPGGARLRSDDRSTDDRLSVFLGCPVTLEPRGRNAGADDSSLSLLTTASVAALRALIPGTPVVDARRFRPNFYIETPSEVYGFVERAWAGHILEIGRLRLQGGEPSERCGMATHAQAELPRAPALLHALVSHADRRIGLYARATRAGHVRVAEHVQLVAVAGAAASAVTGRATQRPLT